MYYVHRKSSTNVGYRLNQRQSWVRSIHGFDWIVSGWVKNFPLLMNRIGVAPIAKSVLKYINITSIAYLHCLLRFLSGLVLLVPELVVCMGWIGSVRSWVGSSWINCWTCCMLHVGESRRTQHP